MPTTIKPTALLLAHYMAGRIVIEAQTAIKKRGRFSLVLSGGGTPQALFDLLGSPNIADRIDWQRTHLFWADERCVPPTEDGSNYKQAKAAIIDHVPIPPKNVWRIKGELDPVAAANDYANQLERFADGTASPHFDLVLLGMGGDGHTASLFPNSPVELEGATVPVEANYDDRPARRVSLTPSALNNARNIWFLVTGSGKADMVKTVLDGEQNLSLYPAQRIRPKNGNLLWFLDKKAASQIV